jgi:hypothetical protein
MIASRAEESTGSRPSEPRLAKQAIASIGRVLRRVSGSCWSKQKLPFGGFCFN